MADVYTSTNTNSSTAVSTNLITAALDKAIEFKHRSQPLHRKFADKRPVALTNQGSTVTFNKYNRLTPTTTAIDEIVSPDAVQIPATDTVSVVMQEYGRVVIPTLKLRTVTFADLDPGVIDILADDLADSLDSLVRAVLNGGTNKVTSNAGARDATAVATNTLTAADIMSDALARYTTVKLRGGSVTPWFGDDYAAIIHPDVAHDLRAGTSNGDWRDVHAQSAPEEIFAGSVGRYEGAVYIETPRAYNATDGASSARVYRTLYLGKKALAEAVAIEPHSTISDKPVDYHNRNYALGWYGFLGWNRFFEEAIYRVETGSSVA